MNDLIAPIGDLNTHLDFTSVLIQMTIAVLLSLLIQAHFHYFSSTISNRKELRYVIPFICLTTVLVISVVKSSLALSLGLVGALSIVRFRTPIKEPEELAYIFLAIAAGLGIGASQYEGTIVAITVILAVMGLVKKNLKAAEEKDVYLNIDLYHIDDPDLVDLNHINKLIAGSLSDVDLVRYGCVQNHYQLIYRTRAKSPESLPTIMKDIKSRHPDSSINFIESPKNPGL